MKFKDSRGNNNSFNYHPMLCKTEIKIQNGC